MTGSETAAQAMLAAREHFGAQRLKQAEQACLDALKADPARPEALNLLGVIANMGGDSARAAELIGRALLGQPDNPNFLSNLGMALHAGGKPDDALAAYDRALALKPGHPQATRNRANLLSDRAVGLQRAGRYEEALAAFAQARAADPGSAQAEYNESLCLLTVGDFRRGWRQYEARWRMNDFREQQRGFLQPLWLGDKDVRGRTLLLHAEQGQGDTLQFARYVPQVAARGARVVLEVQPTLKSLLARIEGAERVLGRGEMLPPFHLHCPLMSLPLALGGEGVPPAAVPYLQPSPAAVRKWEALLGEKAAMRIGVVWSGQPGHHNDRNRSLALERLLPLAATGAQLVSLQKEVRPQDEAVLRANAGIRHFGADLVDYADTAALVSLLDLVISVDTSVAHLTGALGKPAWILLPFVPDWRWQLGREDSPWYPQARLFRQPKAGDWDSVIAALLAALAARA
jgi:tetratricopeptide (TPR) repeat protein